MSNSKPKKNLVYRIQSGEIKVSQKISCFASALASFDTQVNNGGVWQWHINGYLERDADVLNSALDLMAEWAKDKWEDTKIIRIVAAVVNGVCLWKKEGHLKDEHPWGDMGRKLMTGLDAAYFEASPVFIEICEDWLETLIKF